MPQQNVEFIREFLENEGFPILSSDVGGYHPRHVHFYTGTGRAFIKRLGAEGRARLLKEEQALPAAAAAAPPAYGDVTLF